MIRMSSGKRAFIILQYCILPLGGLSFLKFNDMTFPIAETPLSVLPARVNEGSGGKERGMRLTVCITLKMYS